MTFDTHTLPDKERAANAASEAITHLISVYAPDPVLILFSGGSPMEIFTYLPADPFDMRITVGVSDERFSDDPTINNFAQILATPWYHAARKTGVQSIDTRPLPGESVHDAGLRFDGALKAWKEANPVGKIVITQGIGLDGHTAGMMPYPEDEQTFRRLFDDPEVWAVGYDAKEKNKYPLRVTTTIPYLTMADTSVMYVCGEDKKAPLSRVLAQTGSLHETPGRIIHRMKHCLLFTDLSL